MQKRILIKAHRDANSRRGQTSKSPHKCKNPHKQISTYADVRGRRACTFTVKRTHTNMHAYTQSPGVTVGLQYEVSVCGLVLLTTLWCKYTAAYSWPAIRTTQWAKRRVKLKGATRSDHTHSTYTVDQHNRNITPYLRGQITRLTYFTYLTHFIW